MQKSKEEILKIVTLACSAAVFFVSPLFLLEVIVDNHTLLTLFYIVASGFIYLLALIDKNKKTIFLKWLLSIPIAVFIWWTFVRCEYDLRAINWVNPGYGRRSAGGTILPGLMMLLLTILCFIGFIISIFVKPKQNERLRKIQFLICISLMGVIVIVAYTLAILFPSAASLHG